MSLEAALNLNTETMRELIAALLATSKEALNITPAESCKPTLREVVEQIKADPEAARKQLGEGRAKEQAEAKKEQPASDSDTTKTSGEAISNSEPENEPTKAETQFTFAEVQKLVTTLAAPGAYTDGRAKAVAVLQRHGLKKFTEEQVKGDAELVNKVGAMLTAAIAGEIDPREGA